MLGSGLLTVESGLAIIIGCNIGTTLLVVIATLDIQLFVLVMLGVAGISFASSRLSPARTFLLAVFGIGLVFLGLRDAPGCRGAARRNEPWVRDTPRRGRHVLLSSSSWSARCSPSSPSRRTRSRCSRSRCRAAGVLVVRAVRHGDLWRQCRVERAHLRPLRRAQGTAAPGGDVPGRLQLRRRRWSWSRCSISRSTAASRSPSRWSRRFPPTCHYSLPTSMSSSIRQRDRAHTLHRPVRPRILARLYPPPPEESDARPQYIYDQAVQEPETALDLVAREQQRLAGYLPRLLDIARGGTKDATVAIARRRRGDRQPGGRPSTSSSTGSARPAAHTRPMNGSIRRSTSQRILDGLSETLTDLARAVLDAGASPTTRRLTDSVVEGLDAVLLTVIEAMGPDGADDRALASPDERRPRRADEAAPRRVSRKRREPRCGRQDDDPDDHQPHRARLLADQPPGRRATRTRRSRSTSLSPSERRSDERGRNRAGPHPSPRQPSRGDWRGRPTKSRGFCAARGVPQAAIGHLNLALDEAMTNTIEYGWPDGGDHETRC